MYSKVPLNSETYRGIYYLFCIVVVVVSYVLIFTMIHT